MPADSTISVHSHQPSAALAPCFTAFYRTETVAAGGLVDDCPHPERAALRFTKGAPPVAGVGPGALVPQWPFVANGPTSKAIHFGPSPRQCAALPHPILQPIMRQRMSDAGALDATDLPTVARYGG